MKTLIQMIEQEHGKEFYHWPEEKQLYHIALYAQNAVGAIEFLQKYQKKKNAKQPIIIN